MKISTYIFVCFIFILALFAVTTFINYQLSEEVNENTSYISRSTSIMKNSARFQRNMLSMVNGLRGYLITGEKYFIATYDTAVYDNENILGELSLIIEDPAQEHLLTEIKLLNDKWIDEYADPLKHAKSESNVSDSSLAAFNKLYREKFIKSDEKELQLRIQEKYRDFSNSEYARRSAKSTMLAAAVKRTKNLSIFLTVFSLLAGLIIVVFLVKGIVKRIAKMVDMANEIASGNYNVSVEEYKGNDELSALVKSLNHMSKELARNIGQLEVKNNELEQFARSVSHDLKSPLRGIENVVKWIEEDHSQELTPVIKEFITTIKGRVERAGNLINGILAYARTGSEVLNKEKVDLNLLLKEVITDLPKRPGIHVKVSPLPVIFTERIPLLQIFSNLLGNAIKYCDKAECNVQVSYRNFTKYLEFSVTDNGPGIAEIYHKKIFIIFQTLVERDAFETTGVGLAIVKKILDSRKETINVTSKPGAGCTFTFTWTK